MAAALTSTDDDCSAVAVVLPGPEGVVAVLVAQVGDCEKAAELTLGRPRAACGASKKSFLDGSKRNSSLSLSLPPSSSLSLL